MYTVILPIVLWPVYEDITENNTKWLLRAFFPLPSHPRCRCITGMRRVRCEMLGKGEKGRSGGQDSWSPGLVQLLSHRGFGFVVLVLSFQIIDLR